jgi:O-acetyl-ADP-ribose deacetylase (regulator of RNase III)
MERSTGFFRRIVLMGQIHIVTADITELEVDVIVNAANTTLLGGGGVDGAIHRVAGAELLDHCRPLGGCPVGEAKLTPGFKLPAKWVIHTVGPIWQGGTLGEPKLLQACYENSLALAAEHQLQQIAFPGISTGVYGYPKPQAAEIALAVMQGWQDRFQRIIVCCFSEADAELYQSLCSGCIRE